MVTIPDGIKSTTAITALITGLVSGGFGSAGTVIVMRADIARAESREYETQRRLSALEATVENDKLRYANDRIETAGHLVRLAELIERRAR